MQRQRPMRHRLNIARRRTPHRRMRRRKVIQLHRTPQPRLMAQRRRIRRRVEAARRLAGPTLQAVLIPQLAEPTPRAELIRRRVERIMLLEGRIQQRAARTMRRVVHTMQQAVHTMPAVRIRQRLAAVARRVAEGLSAIRRAVMMSA